MSQGTGDSHSWYPVLELSPPQVMVSVEARELTWLTKNESKQLKMSVTDMMLDMLPSEAQRSKECEVVNEGQD